MTAILDLLPSALICPGAVVYYLLLNDRWRISRTTQLLLLFLSSPVSLTINAVAEPLPLPLRVSCIWLVILPLCWYFSEVRDSRFLFVVATGLMFTYLSTCWSNSVSVYLHVHRVLLRIALDSVLFLLTVRLFRPAFRKVYQIPGWDWPIYSVMPLALFVIFFGLLMMPDYAARYALPYVQVFIQLLSILTLFFYGGSLYFFRQLGRWQESEMDWAVLDAQIAVLAATSAGETRSEERRRILRHDVRHYLRILPRCLQMGDTAAALKTVEALRASLSQADAGQEEAANDR